MKRFFFSVIALATVAIGCTKSGLVELPENMETPITFEPYTGKTPTTKATIMDKDALEDPIYDEDKQVYTKGGFHVFAFSYTNPKDEKPNYDKPYMDENVWRVDAVEDDPTTDENETAKAYWDYEGKAYWPDGNLDFLAYGLNAERHMDFSTNKVFTYTVPSLVSDQEDLIVAIPQTNATNNNGKAINLPFQHLLSKVGFSLQTNYADQNVKVVIKKIELTGDFYTQGTVDMALVGDNAEETSTYGKPYIDAKTDATTDSYSFFGTKGANGTVVSYDKNVAGEYDCFVGDSKGLGTTNAPVAPDPIYANHTITVVDASNQGNPAPKGADDKNRYMMIIPTAAQTDARIKVTYQLTGDIERTAEAKLTNGFQFKAGMGYEFVLKVSTLKVDFSVKVDEWAPAGTADGLKESYTLTPVTPEETPEA